ncbi:MAG: hypothetical protein U0790_29720 [Isosphaeraceae bacterium]
MSRLLKTAVVLGVAALPVLPAYVLRAQPPAPATKEARAKSSESPKAKAPEGVVDRIKEEGLKNSKVMETLSYLTDVIGPRLTGSPNLKRANEWTRDTLAKWGLENAHLEPWGPFGKELDTQAVARPRSSSLSIPLIAYLKAWSPGTEGTLVADVVYLDVKNDSDYDKYKGKLKGDRPGECPGRRPGPLRALGAPDDGQATLLDLADAPNLPSGARAVAGCSGAPPAAKAENEEWRGERLRAQTRPRWPRRPIRRTPPRCPGGRPARLGRRPRRRMASSAPGPRPRGRRPSSG